MPSTCSSVACQGRVYVFASHPDLRTRLHLRLLHSPQGMRVLGIDCGGEYTGYGVVEQDDAGCLCHICSGAIRLQTREALELRLKAISDALEMIIAQHHPELVAIEDVFYAVNAKSAL